MIFVQTFKSNEFVGLLKNLLQDGGALFSADRAGQLKIEVDLPGEDPAEVKLSFTADPSKRANVPSQMLDNAALEGIIAENSRVQVALGVVREMAETADPVLIYGEHGTGKDVFAQAIHKVSRRKNLPFVILPCGSLGENGVKQSVKEYLTAVESGTLLLDGVHDLSPLAQRELSCTLGRDNKFRTVATTSVDLEKSVTAEKFSGDLLSRLQGGYIELPPLRERSDDVEALAAFCVQRYCRAHHLEPKSLSPELLQVLQAYRWPGNVRELVNTIEQLLIMAQRRQTLFARDLPDHIRIQTIKSASAFKKGL